MSAAEKIGVPLSILQINEPDLQRVYNRGLLLVRPDQHIAWRGLSCDNSVQAATIIARALGWEDSSAVMHVPTTTSTM